MTETLDSLLDLIAKHHGINDKARLAQIACAELALTKDRSVYYCRDYAVRFSSSARRSFGNTVLSLSNLRKYDDRPFVVCLVTATQNHCFAANTTFLKKISHSSEELRANNIRGSFNGSDIVKEFEGIVNSADNIGRLFDIHAEIGFEGNLARLVEATNNISPSGLKYHIGDQERCTILEAPGRAVRFVSSCDAVVLKTELDAMVDKFRNEILLAALIENVNVRGRVIEYLIAGDDELLRQRLVESLKSATHGLAPFKTANTLGDYQRQFTAFDTETDVKTKILILNSNPKAYNLDKMLEFLARDKSVFMFYFVGVDPGKTVSTALVSMFHQKLLGATILLRHWAGRNSRGVSQFEGRVIDDLIADPKGEIDQQGSLGFLARIMEL